MGSKYGIKYAEKSLFDLIKTFEFTNGSCNVQLINFNVESKEKYTYLIERNKNAKAIVFKYIKLPKTDTLSSDYKKCKPLNMMLLLKSDFKTYLENKEKDKKTKKSINKEDEGNTKIKCIDLITEFSYLSSNLRGKNKEHNRAKDINNFIEKYGWIFSVIDNGLMPKSYEISDQKIVSWSERLKNFAFLFSEVINNKEQLDLGKILPLGYLFFIQRF